LDIFEADPKTLVEAILPVTLEDIFKQFEKSFDDHKNVVQSFPKIGAKTGLLGERVNVHPFVREILTDLLPKMIPGLLDRYDILYEEATEPLEATPKKFREIPDFGIHVWKGLGKG
jgi:hypothetical protein